MARFRFEAARKLSSFTQHLAYWGYNRDHNNVAKSQRALHFPHTDLLDTLLFEHFAISAFDVRHTVTLLRWQDRDIDNRDTEAGDVLDDNIV